MKRLTVLALGVLALVALGACYDPDGLQEDRFEAQQEVFGDRVGETGGEPTATPTPADPDATVDPNDPSSALIQGQPVGDYFAGLCAACHGLNREGGVGLPLTRDRLTEPDEFYHDTIVNGREGTAMAPYGGGPALTDAEVSAIVTWLKNTDP